ncbi:hypothetical protein JCM3765_005933 [Sporobolomyces pararoseus]
MSTEFSAVVSTSRIDYLSTLPDELLETIFRDAYDKHRPRGPLSKHLLPYYERNLYRSIEFKSPQHFHDLEVTLGLKPRLGGLVRNVNFKHLWAPEVKWDPDCGDYIDYPFEDYWFSTNSFPFARILRHLVNLKTLDISNAPSYLGDVATSFLQTKSLQNLRQFTVAVPREKDHLDLQALEWIADLPELQSLSLTTYYFVYGVMGIRKMSRRLTKLKTLSIIGEWVHKEVLENLVLCCPALMSFIFDPSVASGILPTLLPLLPSDLRTLELHSVDIVDSLLPRFQHLTHLRLFGNTFSDNTHLSLLQLHNLQLLEIGDPSSHDFLAQLESLVSGPTRLPELKSLSVEVQAGKGGARMKSPLGEGFDWKRDGWYRGSLSDWSPPLPITSNLSESRRFIQTAAENNIRVGRMEDNLKLMEKYFIEANNRSVALAYFEDDFDPIKMYRRAAKGFGITLPPLVFESLRRDIRITETKLPDKNWFALSLRNADDPDDDEEEEEWTGRSSESESEAE